MAIKRLFSGGLIVNYNCTSRCGHCLYACSPQRDKDYIDPARAEDCLRAVKALGCGSVHVGGGEPFINTDGLAAVLEAARSAKVGIEYVETNSSWFKDPGSAREVLAGLRQSGLKRLLISISPFHNEHIPFYKVKGVIEACRQTGLDIFPWIPQFYPEVESFDDARPHPLAEYAERFGRDYLQKITGRYWVHFGGRAAYTFSEIFECLPWPDLLSRHPRGCGELLDVSHFHVDLYGQYVPGLCSGLSMALEDLGRPLDPDKYVLLNILFESGIKGLFESARRDYGFAPQEKYLNKCHFCLDIRRYLALKVAREFPELSPKGFYTSLPGQD